MRSRARLPLLSFIVCASVASPVLAQVGRVLELPTSKLTLDLPATFSVNGWTMKSDQESDSLAYDDERADAHGRIVVMVFPSADCTVPQVVFDTMLDTKMAAKVATPDFVPESIRTQWIQKESDSGLFTCVQKAGTSYMVTVFLDAKGQTRVMAGSLLQAMSGGAAQVSFKTADVTLQLTRIGMTVHVPAAVASAKWKNGVQNGMDWIEDPDSPGGERFVAVGLLAPGGTCATSVKTWVEQFSARPIAPPAFIPIQPPTIWYTVQASGLNLGCLEISGATYVFMMSTAESKTLPPLTAEIFQQIVAGKRQ